MDDVNDFFPQVDEGVTHISTAATSDIVAIPLLQCPGCVILGEALAPVRLQRKDEDGFARLVVFVLRIMPPSLGFTQVVPVGRAIAGA